MSVNSSHITQSAENIPKDGGAQIVLYQPDESISLEVKLDVDADTVWLSQQQIADLFGVQKAAISKHMKNIFSIGELERDRVVSKMETTASDGKHYNVDYYNLDMILSVCGVAKLEVTICDHQLYDRRRSCSYQDRCSPPSLRIHRARNYPTISSPALKDSHRGVHKDKRCISCYATLHNCQCWHIATHG